MLSHVWLFVTPWNVGYSAPLSMEFSRQECWSGLPFPPPESLPKPEIESASLMSPALAGRFCILAPPGKPLCSVQFSHSVVSHSLQSHGLQMPGFPVLHQLPELAQTHAHRISEAILPPHPLLCISPPAFNISQHQGLFQWVSSSHQVAKTLELQLHHQSFQWIFRTDFL